MKWNTDDLPVFLALCETQGVRAAATRLDMPKSTVSRCLSRLEENLDVRLIDRNTRQFRLTAEGERFLLHAQLIMEQVVAADEAISGLRHKPGGSLKIALPMAFSREVIGGRLAEFTTRFPDIRLEVLVTSQQVNLLTEDIDVALAVGPFEDSELNSQKIVETPLIWVASPSYVAQFDWTDQLAALRSHIKFCERRYKSRHLVVKGHRGRQYLDTSAAMSVNDSILLREVIMQGGGVGLMPELYCRNPLRSGALVQVCPAIIPEPRAQIVALTASRRLYPQKTRVFVDFARQCVKDYQSLGTDQTDSH